MRDYDPAIGRYIESDPIGLQGGLNTYSYVAADPLGEVDPYGLQVPMMGGAGAGSSLGGGGLLGGGALGGRGGNAGSGSNWDGWGGSSSLGGANWGGSNSWGGSGADSGNSDRSIPKPAKPKCGCTCICRADANDNIPGNVKPGEPSFAFGEATADSCAKASKEAKRQATHKLGKQPKHVDCRCTD